ncbi:DUF6538 domain-containing protein [Burkholderia sp. ISTR5]|uniref:DUF6538 domain-containing protein n=1 Tax=Burkholderia sp. ISTR5 TaxID=2500161 RepID=UPI002ED354FB
MTDLATPTPPGLHLRPGTTIWHLRIGVPKDLQQFYRDPRTGKAQPNAYRASLGTSDRSEAITRALRIIAEHREHFALLRAKAAPERPVTLTPALSQAFADFVRTAFLHEDDHATFVETDQAVKASSRAYFKSIKEKATSQMLEGNLEGARLGAEVVAALWGLKVDWNTPEGQRCLIQISRTIVQSMTAIEQRQLGEPIDTPRLPSIAELVPEPPTSTNSPTERPATLRDVVPYWIKRRAPAKAAIDQTERSLKRFEEAVGVLPLDQITKKTGAAFVDWLLDPERGFGHKTASDVAASINALAKIAVEVDLLDRNPMLLRIDKSIGAGQRTPWTDDELSRLFGHALFSDQMNTVPHWNNVMPSDGRAALLLLLHTGARLGEIAQLRRQDFQMHGGVRTLRITEEAGTVKTRESNRTIPLAAHLMADPWFVGWLASMGGSDGAAFPSLSRPKAREVDVLSKWFLAMREQCKLPMGRNMGSHRFRHWLRSALAAKDVGDATADAITGHAAQGSAGRKVYTVTSLAAMAEALNRINWPNTCGPSRVSALAGPLT